MFFEIREATSKDMSSVLKLIKELAVFENEPDEVEVTVTELEQDFKNNLFKCYVAVENNIIIGAALFYNRYSTWKGKTIHLEDLIVTQAYRGKGVGGALLAKIVEKAKAEKLRRVEWNVLDWNTSAIDFYKSVGAKVFSEWCVVQLDENGINTY